MKKLLITAAIFIISSCSHQDQKVRIEFTNEDIRSNVGNGVGVSLTTSDERFEPDFLGSKEFCDDAKISIVSKQDLATLVQRRINQGLMDKGFVKGRDKFIEIAIKDIKYEAECKFLLGKSEAHALIKVSSTDAKTKTKITKNFELSLKNKHFLIPLSSSDESTINNLLNEIIQDILNDDILLK